MTGWDGNGPAHRPVLDSENQKAAVDALAEIPVYSKGEATAFSLEDTEDIHGYFEWAGRIGTALIFAGTLFGLSALTIIIWKALP